MGLKHTAYIQGRVIKNWRVDEKNKLELRINECILCPDLEKCVPRTRGQGLAISTDTSAAHTVIVST